MCTYSMIADYARKWWPEQADRPWSRPQLDELEEILRRVKEMEDRLGVCPCPNEDKRSFLDQIRERLDGLERKLG